MKEYAIYLRKSRADLDAEALGQGETLARHRRQLLELADRNGYEIGEIYQEIISGDSIEARPEMLRLLSDVEKQRWEGVLCMDIDRLARGDSADQGRITRTFSLTDTLIITPSRTYDMANDDDEEYADFGLFIARKEYKSTRRRMMRGRIASAREGHFIGSTPPFGYDKVRLEKGRGYTLAPNSESEAVKLIFSMCISGDGCTKIAKRLDGLGVTPRSGGKWSRATVADILQNPVYCGKIRWQYRREKKSSSGGRITKHRTVTGEYILVHGLHQALVSDEDFQRAQEEMDRRKRTSVNIDASLRNPLAGLVYCGRCGALMQRMHAKKGIRISCPNTGCDNVSTELYLVEEAVLSGLSEWLNTSVEAKKPLKSPKDEIARNTVAMLRARLEKLSEQKNRIYAFLEQDIYTPDEFRERMKALTEQQNSTQKQLSAAEAELAETAHAPHFREIIPQVRTVIDIYRSADAEDKNRLLKSVVERVNYTKTKRCTRGKGDTPQFNLEILPKFPA
ncbi:MAG: recombinase family protein [Oscillospiraceae bacterium]